MTLSVTRAGITYPLDDGTVSYYLGDDGMGMAPIEQFSYQGVKQDGDTYKGFRMLPRMVKLILEIDGTDIDDLYDKRAQLLHIFKPGDDTLTLTWYRSKINRTRCLDVRFFKDLIFTSSDRKGFVMKVLVTLKANNPLWYDPAPQEVSFSLGGGSSGPVPILVPMTVGSSTLSQTLVVPYTGEWRCNPFLIRITGPISNAKLTHNNLNVKIDFNGYTISAGDYYDIDCRYLYRTVKDSAGVSQRSKLSNDSSLSDFYISPDPDVGGGLNSLTVVGSSITANTKIDINFQNLFPGN